jgi:hypothetical protein
MAKSTKTKSAKAVKPSVSNSNPDPDPISGGEVAQNSPVETKEQVQVIDLANLSASQLKELREQLKEKSKESVSVRKERFEIIDSMLQVKDGDEFVHTTREIADALNDANLADTSKGEDWYKEEIKKIQARKQFLEKKTDEKANLVYEAGTFGYKRTATGGGGKGLSASKVKLETIVAFFEADRGSELNGAQLAVITAKLKALQ